jgi:hypothetical protein
MLSDHSTRRDHYGIPIVKNEFKICFAEDSLSSGEELEIIHWNELHRSLASITADVRDLQQRTEFLENWLLRYLKPMDHPFIQQPVDQTIDSINDTSVEDEIATLKDREKHVNTCQTDKCILSV